MSKPLVVYLVGSPDNVHRQEPISQQLQVNAALPVLPEGVYSQLHLLNTLGANDTLHNCQKVLCCPNKVLPPPSRKDPWSLHYHLLRALLKCLCTEPAGKHPSILFSISLRCIPIRESGGSSRLLIHLPHFLQHQWGRQRKGKPMMLHQPDQHSVEIGYVPCLRLDQSS